MLIQLYICQNCIVPDFIQSTAFLIFSHSSGISIVSMSTSSCFECASLNVSDCMMMCNKIYIDLSKTKTNSILPSLGCLCFDDVRHLHDFQGFWNKSCEFVSDIADKFGNLPKWKSFSSHHLVD